MSFFKKIKQGLGIGTAKASLVVSESLSKDAEEIKGQLNIAAKSDQSVKSIKIYLQKVSNVTVGEEQQRKVEVIESLILGDAFEIKEDEEKTIDFVMPLQFNKPDAASVNVKGWTVSFGASNPLEIDVFSSSSTWVEVMATVDLEGVAIDPTSTQRLTIF